ncbi:MAG TPA: TIM barrel protein, partial [Propionibacteriaceae bacterium]|nr:TIM barrel protein [Propionibacteriaceae bacterium]
TQTTWGNDPWEKLNRSAEAAHRLGAGVVVVHPPFRWQRDYARDFVTGIKRLNEESGVVFSVENMYPWRTGGPTFKAYLPGWDPSELDYDHLTLDLSHASTSRVKSMDYVDAWGSRLRHVHLTDGTGAKVDAHLLPGEGDQDAWHLVEELARRRFDGQIVLEVNTRGMANRSQREQALGQVLADIRSHLEIGAAQAS